VTVLKLFYLIKLTAFSYWNVFIPSQPKRYIITIIHVSFTVFPTAEVFLTFKAVSSTKWNGIGAYLKLRVTGKLKNKNTFVPNLAILIKWLCQTAYYYNVMYGAGRYYIEFLFLFSHIRAILKKKMFFSHDTQMYILYINDIHFSSFRNRYVFNFEYYIIFKYFIFARNNVCFSYSVERYHHPPPWIIFAYLFVNPWFQFNVSCSNSLFYFCSILPTYLLNILLRLIVFPFRPPDKNLNRQDTIKFYAECRSHRFILYTRRFNTSCIRLLLYYYVFSNIFCSLLIVRAKHYWTQFVFDIAWLQIR